MKEEERILSISERNRQHALNIIEELNLFEIWKKYGAKANLIGSVATGLIMKNKDIDFHIYSGCFSIADTFSAMAEIAENKHVKRVTYDNLLDTEEMCLEWHAWYETNENELWQIDMIHILNDSPYAGRMEKVTERINKMLTPDKRTAILSIKYDVPDDKKIKGIEIYQAVLRDGIKNYKEFTEWKKAQINTAIIDWML